MRTKQFLLCLLALLGSITAHAYDLDMNGVYYNITDADAKNVEVTYVENGDGNADFYYGSVTIPRRFSKDGVTYNVTAIGANAFTQCTSLTAVTIPTSVTSIGGGAFYGCSSLTSIAIPSSVTSIGNEAFKGCTSLTAVNISDLEAWCKIDFANGSYQNPLTYAHRLYLNGNELTELVVPEGITDLKITFDHCHSLTSVSLPSSVKTISDYAFNDCVNITSVNLAEGLVAIGTNAFDGCSKLLSIDIPEGVTAIYNCAFRNCQRLLSVSLPSSMTFIDSYTFQNCWDLKNVVIPANTTQIGKYAFSNCYSLKSMVVSSSTPPVFGETTLNDACTIFVPNNSVETYKAADGWSTYASRIKPLTGWTFDAAVPCGEGTASLTFKVTNASPWEVEVSASPEDIAGALTIPATVQNENGIEFAVWGIGDNAFNNRTNLTAVEMPESVTTIGGSAFYGCTGLTSVTSLGNLTHIWGHAFRGCTSLSDVQIAGVHEISVYVFEGCTSLKSINLPEGLTYIYDSAFRGSGLESITFPSTLTSVGIAAFRDCHALKTIDFNNCTATLEAEVFLGTAIEELVIPETVILKGWTNFGWCPELRSVEMKNINQTAHNDVFKACAKLETAILPKIAVMTTGYFENCTNLRSVTFLSGAPGNDGRQYCDKNFQDVPDDVLFIIPEGTAESYLKSGYKNLSDKSGLPLVREEFEAEAARITTMAEALNDGDKTALNTAITSARTTVNSTDDYMTIYAQIAAIKTAAKTFLTTASLPNEFDVTAAAITNPDFDRFQMGWKTTGGGEKRGWMGEPGYYHLENGDVILDYFIEAWNFRSYVNDGELSQTITSLPAGIYRLEADIIATNQNNASAEITGVSLFAASQKTGVATENQKPQHFSVKFENPVAKDVTIGINISGTNANWVAMDNVRLFYEGKATDIPQGIDLASDENARVYLYNVETGKYLSAGHSYGTHAMLDETGLPVRLTQNAETGLWQIYFWEGSKSDQLLFSHYSSEKREEVYVDYDHSRSDADEDLTLWSITQAGDGSYLIQNKKYLDSEFYLGNIPTRQDAQNEYNGVSYTDIISKASVNDNSHWLIFTKENSDQLSAKHRLMAAIMRMEESESANEDLLATAHAIYEDADATSQEVVDIIIQLNSQMGMPAENQPVDMTALIINPRFENNTTEGWSGANVVGGRSDATSNHEQEFYQKSFNMYQVISGVPNGRYMLKWKGFHRPGPDGSNWDTYTAGTDNASAVVYANEVEHTMLNHASSGGSPQVLVNTDNEYQYGGNWYPHTMESARAYFDAGYYIDQLEVVVTDNVLTIGVKNTQEMGSEHWVIFSDFELYIMENAEQLNNRLVATTGKGLSGGRATLPVNMTNADEIAGIQFKIRTPQGITVATDGAGKPKIKATSRLNNMTMKSAQNEDYTEVLIYGIGEYVEGNSGSIANVEVDISEALGLGDYKIEIYDIILTKKNALEIAPFSVKSTLTLVDAELGDANRDGRVNVTDIIAVANHILHQSQGTFDETAADINGDNKINVTDIIGIANIILKINVPKNAPMKNQVLDPQ